jgi:hypothetical protein
MWCVKVGGIQPESRTTWVGDFDDLDAIRAYLEPLAVDLKIVERQCASDRVQWIVKARETHGVAGLLAHLDAVVYEAEARP